MCKNTFKLLSFDITLVINYLATISEVQLNFTEKKNKQLL